jgi:hypothetical protein
MEHSRDAHASSLGAFNKTFLAIAEMRRGPRRQ